MAKRLCSTPGCPNLVDRGHCPTHASQRTAAREATRPSYTARGYGARHRAARTWLASRLPSPCYYCGETIESPADLDAAHLIDGDESAGWVAAHSLCNQRAKKK